VADSQTILPLPTQSPAELTLTPPAPVLPRWAALLQVILVCGIPTQLVAATILALVVGMRLFDDGGIAFEFFATVSLLDTAMVAVLIRLFLVWSGENSSEVFLGKRPIKGEILRGLALLPVVFLAVTSIVLAIRTLAPWMHNVEKSPLEAFMRTPLDTAIFLFVVVLAGGVREELQRAFILHRFGQRLGGVNLGLLLFSAMFGALHVDQGFDVAVAIGLLGFLWGILYIRRRSAVMSMVNHASFNAAQVVQTVIVKALGA
jgi:membrane protease YdiL (CAAX protease family)